MIGILLAGGFSWEFVGVFAGAAAVGLVAWAFMDKWEENYLTLKETRALHPSPEATHPEWLEANRKELERSTGTHVMPELEVPDDFDPPSAAPDYDPGASLDRDER